MARKPYMRRLGGKTLDIPVKEFNYIDRLSQKAMEKYAAITSKERMQNLGYISTNLSKFNIRFGGWEEGWRNFKTNKGMRQYKEYLEDFLQPDWEFRRVEQYKYNLKSAMKNVLQRENIVALDNALDDINSVEEFEYVWSKTNSRIDIAYVYAKGAEDAQKIYRSVTRLINKYKQRYRSS